MSVPSDPVDGHPGHPPKYFWTPVTIWRDPQFVNLDQLAQLIYFRQGCMGPGRALAHAEMATLWNVPISEINTACNALVTAGYGDVLEMWPQREKPQRRWISQSTRRAVYRRDGNRCLACGTRKRLTLDHIYPYSLGGNDEIANLQTLCQSCNSKKGARVAYSFN